ncbi:hypothetical protein ABIB57_003200 [Devosia sp. UYZn731]
MVNICGQTPARKTAFTLLNNIGVPMTAFWILAFCIERQKWGRKPPVGNAPISAVEAEISISLKRSDRSGSGNVKNGVGKRLSAFGGSQRKSRHWQVDEFGAVRRLRAAGFALGLASSLSSVCQTELDFYLMVASLWPVIVVVELSAFARKFMARRLYFSHKVSIALCEECADWTLMHIGRHHNWLQMQEFTSALVVRGSGDRSATPPVKQRFPIFGQVMGQENPWTRSDHP